jgi:CDP-diglyceride synthetase
LVIAQILILLLAANGAPAIATRSWGHLLSLPVDCGLSYFDGRRLLGPSKTFRGVVLSIMATSACAPIIGLEWNIEAVVGSAAMAGDLFSSFVKRRVHLPASSRAIGLDQIPESLFPLLSCRSMLALTPADIIVAAVLFFIGELALSRLLYKIRIRRQPY